MPIISRRFVATVAALFVAVTCLASAQQPAPATSAGRAALTDRIPADPLITTGRFQNGLRYYIRQNQKPEKRAELRLVVNAGSILEDDDQLGLAHFVEHMAFNGTKHFPKQEMVHFMESIGMRFGAHVNAYTSFDETVYQLQVPTDKPELLEKSMLILEDWARGVSFDAAEIDKERGVVTEEWRLGRGAGARMQDKQFPTLLKGSRYADRLPIGKLTSLQQFKHARLKQFYADWYRPDLMAVVAVGDIDKTAIENLIKSHFGTIPMPSGPRTRTSYPVPDQPGTLFAIATDKEADSTSVSIYNKHDLRDPSTVGAYRQQMIERLFSNMLSTRFAELAQKADPPFLGAGASRGLFVRTKEATTLAAGVKDDGIERGVDALFTEAERVARFGFTDGELSRIKLNLMRYLEQAVTEKDKQESSSLADEYVRNFTDREPIPGIVYEYELHQRFLPEITLAEINKLTKDWTPDRNRVVVISAPEKADVKVPDGPKLSAVIAAASKKELTAYVDAVASKPLVDKPPTPGTVVSTATKDAYGITEWVLSNGVKVVLKPTTFKQDEIVFRAVSPGGTSLASDQDFVAASVANTIVAAGGLGPYGAIDLRKALAGKVAAVGPFFANTYEGIGGSASKKDLETAFQLIYLTFTQPRADPTMFGVLMAQLNSSLANQSATPEFAYSSTLEKALSQDHFRARPLTPEVAKEITLEKAFNFYKDRFADASDFTFVFVGSFDLAMMKPLVEQYLGGLPSLNRNEKFKDIGMRPPTTVVEKRVEKGIEPKSQTTIVFGGPLEYNQTTRVELRAMAEVLQTRLRETLREDLGGTYSVTVSPSWSKEPVPQYSVTVDFGSNPERTETLVKTAFAEIEKMKEIGPTAKQLADVKEALVRDLETNRMDNSWLLANIVARYQYGEDLATLFGLSEFYNKLTPTAIQDAAKRYLNLKAYVKVSLFPEKK